LAAATARHGNAPFDRDTHVIAVATCTAPRVARTNGRRGAGTRRAQALSDCHRAIARTVVNDGQLVQCRWEMREDVGQVLLVVERGHDDAQPWDVSARRRNQRWHQVHSIPADRVGIATVRDTRGGYLRREVKAVSTPIVGLATVRSSPSA
jgi:hypothetical protein